MRILLAGTNGQVGFELERSLQNVGEVIAVDRSRMDVADLDLVRETIRAVKPALIVNATAYTAVDAAENDHSLAMRVNAEAPGVMAEEARRLGAALIHYSTDYVFDGSKGKPYEEDDRACALSVYGKSKLAGERAIIEQGIPHIILRTSWVYGMRGKNFLRTVLRLAAERDELRIVDDQYGAPTWSRTIADATAQIVAQSLQADDANQWWQERAGIYHLTSAGETTWCGFTRAILAHAALSHVPALIPITTAEFPTAARRPAYSVLSSGKSSAAFGLQLPPWDKALRLCLSSQ